MNPTHPHTLHCTARLGGLRLLGLHRSASLSLGFTAPLAWPLAHLPAWAGGRTGLAACPFNQHLRALPRIVRAASSLSRIPKFLDFQGLSRWCEATLREIAFGLERLRVERLTAEGLSRGLEVFFETCTELNRSIWAAGNIFYFKNS